MFKVFILNFFLIFDPWPADQGIYEKIILAVLHSKKKKKKREASCCFSCTLFSWFMTLIWAVEIFNININASDYLRFWKVKEMYQVSYYMYLVTASSSK